jgi:toxin-antitoxin system PIN domain toxin
VILVDVNVLVYACRRDAVGHREYNAWLADALSGAQAVGIAPESLAAVVRITTHPRVWKTPLTTAQAFAFVDAVRSAPMAVPVLPGADHWRLFAALCKESDARGNLVGDAWLAALAIEQGCTLVTTDRDFVRFRGVRTEHPLRT